MSPVNVVAVEAQALDGACKGGVIGGLAGHGEIQKRGQRAAVMQQGINHLLW